jgi:hypothetical protein
MSILELEGFSSPDAFAEVPSYQRQTLDDLLASGMTHEAVGAVWLDQIGASTNAPFGTGTTGPSLFENFKMEFNKLLCGDDKYKKVRTDASGKWKEYKSGVVLSIAAAIGNALGTAAIVLVPAVALLLSAALEVGLNAWCATYAPES